MDILKADTTAEALRRLLTDRQPHLLDDPSLFPSAVLLLLYQKEGEYHLLFNKRSDQVEYHKGEICFPGGGQDPEDESPLTTALRETHEEMGVMPEDVRVLGPLDQVRTRTNFLIHPYVGEIPYPYPFKVSGIEISEVLEVPLAALLDPSHLRREWRVSNGLLTEGLAYSHGHHIIFGATANIVTNFLTILSEALGREAPWTARITPLRR